MLGVGTLWRAVPRPIRDAPADLVAVVVAVFATNVAVFAPILRATPLRIPLGLAFVLFVPGYAIVAALVPGGAGARTADDDSSEAPSADGGVFWNRPLQTPLSGGERCVLSLAVSVSIVPLLGLLLNFGLGSVGPHSLVWSMSAVTLAAAVVGTVRRLALPPSERFSVPYEQWYATARNPVSGTGSRSDAVLHISVAVVVVLAVASVGYAVVAIQTGEQFSETAVLTETDGGDLVAGDYPRSFEEGEQREFVFSIENREQRTAEYTVVVVEQETESEGGGSIVEQNELQRFETQLSHDRTWYHAHDVQPTTTGENVRITWLVYLDGDVPAEPSTENAAYSTHRWIEVSPADE